MKRGIDFDIDLTSVPWRTKLFSVNLGYPGVIHALIVFVFTNGSSSTVAGIGLILNPGWRTAIVFFLSLIVLVACILISFSLSNIRCLRAVERHLRKFSQETHGCRYELYTATTFEARYGLRPYFRPVESTVEASTSWVPTSRPSPSLEKAVADLAPIQKLLAQAVVGLLTQGYRFLICVHPGRRKPREFATFNSRDFRFVFLPLETQSLTAARVFSVAHELGHTTQMNTASYFAAESMISRVLALGFLVCCMLWTPLSVSLLVGSLGVYVFFRRLVGSSIMPRAHLRDEVVADRNAVAMLHTSVLQMITDGSFKKLTMGSRHIDSSHSSSAVLFEEAPANDVAAYRYSLLKEEVAAKISDEKGVNPLRYLMSAMDRHGRVIAATATGHEALIGIALAVIAFRFYHLSSFSVVIAVLVTAIYLVIAVTFNIVAKRAYHEMASALDASRWEPAAPTC